jgi:hypothetical protein
MGRGKTLVEDQPAVNSTAQDICPSGVGVPYECCRRCLGVTQVLCSILRSAHVQASGSLATKPLKIHTQLGGAERATGADAQRVVE